MENLKEDNQLLGILKELQKYQATKLTPEQIVEMDKLYLEKCEELNECKKKLEQTTPCFLCSPCEYQREDIKIPGEGCGIVLEAPLKPQDHVYTLFNDFIGKTIKPFECIVTEIKYNSRYPTGRKWQITLNDKVTYEEKDIGEKVFLTKEDAEKAIEKIKTEEKQ